MSPTIIANIPSFFAGQFFCGNKYCDKKESLKSWEVNFGYIEHGEKRNALVKLSKLTSGGNMIDFFKV